MKLGFIVILLAFLCVGFVHAPDGQVASESGPASFVAPDDKALVVFVRPEKVGKAVNFYVFDENKKLLTLFKGNEHVTIAVDPGKHTFYVVSENAALVRAELAAGRTYVIHAQPKMGWGKARVVAHPIFRASSDFDKAAEWIRKTKRGEPDFAKGKKWASKRQDALNTRIAGAEADWLKMDEKVQGGMTMGPEDGRTAEEAGKL